MLNTFEAVKLRYENTTPMRGKRNTELDIRPLDDRRYKHRRIIKVDDNCYALSDGWHYGDPLNAPFAYSTGFKPTPTDTETYSPIVWRRYADGTETVTVRNAGFGSGTVVERHKLLRRWLPRGLKLRAGDRDGRHYIQCASGTHYLPKASMVPSDIYYAMNASGRSGMAITDEATLVFRREGDVFVLASPAPVETKRAVNKELKAAFRKPIAEFREWMAVMLPMMPLGDQRVQQFNKDMSAARGARPTAELVQEVLLDPTHPMRVAMAAVILADKEGWTWNADYSQQQKQDAHKHVNRWMNTYGGFTHAVPK